MSYFSYGETAGIETNGSGVAIGEPDTLLLYDILALQQIYGANTATRSAQPPMALAAPWTTAAPMT